MSAVHVVPLGDSIEHLVPGGLDGHTATEGPWLTIEAVPGTPIADDACACGPTPEHVPNPGDGPDGWMWTHHSVDGRELLEQAPDPTAVT